MFGPEQSEVRLTLLKATGAHEGTFRDFRARALFVGDRMVSIHGTVALSSLRTESPAFDHDVLGVDMLDVAAFPTARFDSVSVVQDGAQWQVSGRLDVHGVTQEITVPITVDTSGLQVQVTASVDFDPREHGVEVDLDNELVDSITVDFSLRAPR